MDFFKGSWKTSVIGVTALVVSGLVFIGTFTPEDATAANAAITSLVENVASSIVAIVGLIGLFARDNNVSSERAGAE
jgi:hypothetical protein